MTKTKKTNCDKFAPLCASLLVKCGGDYFRALETIHTASESAFALGNMKQAEQLQKVAQCFRELFNI